MLSLSRKTEYALIALAHMAERPGEIVSAREIAQVAELPAPLLMNILKTLHRHGIVRSARGARGGYALSTDLAVWSLHELIGLIDGRAELGPKRLSNSSASRFGPTQALRYRLAKLLKDVRVSDLVLPGRRIDVPLEVLYRRPATVVAGVA